MSPTQRNTTTTIGWGQTQHGNECFSVSHSLSLIFYHLSIFHIHSALALSPPIQLLPPIILFHSAVSVYILIPSLSPLQAQSIIVFLFFHLFSIYTFEGWRRGWVGVWVGGFVRLSSCQMCSEDILLAHISSNHLVCVHTASNISTHTFS